MSHRPLHDIAAEIRADYASRGKPVHYSAKPYVDAMMYLGDVSENYGMDPGRDVVIYAVSNLSTWRGDTAKRVKAELREILSHKR